MILCVYYMTGAPEGSPKVVFYVVLWIYGEAKKKNFLWLSLGRNQYRREGLWFVCLLYDGSTRRLTGFKEKPGIEPATPGLQGIALIHYTTGASEKQKKKNFLWLSLGSNQYRREGLWFVCLLYDGSTRRLTESGFMEKPGIEPATPGLQGIALIHYTTGASQGASEKHWCLTKFNYSCLFCLIWFFTSTQQSFSYAGRVFLGWTSTKLG